jgi:hypothetical protein
MELLGDMGQWNLASVHLEILLALMQDPMEALGDVGHVELLFFLIGDSVCVGER